jgi:hypothetical protein
MLGTVPRNCHPKAAEIGRIKVSGQPIQNTLQDPISSEKKLKKL